MIKGNEDIYRRSMAFNTRLINNDRLAKGLRKHPASWSIGLELLLKKIGNHWCWRKAKFSIGR